MADGDIIVFNLLNDFIKTQFRIIRFLFIIKDKWIINKQTKQNKSKSGRYVLNGQHTDR